jgi:hypothetical protein
MKHLEATWSKGELIEPYQISIGKDAGTMAEETHSEIDKFRKNIYDAHLEDVDSDSFILWRR